MAVPRRRKYSSNGGLIYIGVYQVNHRNSIGLVIETYEYTC
jgi:hypothetical protein